MPAAVAAAAGFLSIQEYISAGVKSSVLLGLSGQGTLNTSYHEIIFHQKEEDV